MNLDQADRIIYSPFGYVITQHKKYVEKLTDEKNRFRISKNITNVLGILPGIGTAMGILRIVIHSTQYHHQKSKNIKDDFQGRRIIHIVRGVAETLAVFSPLILILDVAITVLQYKQDYKKVTI